MNYVTGEISVVFDTAPAEGDTVSCVAKNRPKGVNTQKVDTANEAAALIFTHGSVRKGALLVGSSAATTADLAILESVGIYPV